MVDVISRGRLEMGLVKGAPYEIVPSNARPVRVMDRFWEAHDLILKALTTHDGPFSWEGEYFQYRSVNIWPRPFQQPHPPVWSTSSSLGSARELRPARTRARHGDDRLSRQGGVRRVPQGLEGGRTRADDAVGPAGLYGICGRWGKNEAEGLRRAAQVKSYLETNTIVAERNKNPPGFMAAGDAAKVYQRVGWKGPSHTMTTKDGKPLGSAATASVADTIAGGLMFAGTPDQVYAQVVDFYEAIGGFGHFPTMTQAGSMGHADTVENLTLFTKVVKPRLEEYAATKLAA